MYSHASAGRLWRSFCGEERGGAEESGAKGEGWVPDVGRGSRPHRSLPLGPGRRSGSRVRHAARGLKRSLAALVVSCGAGEGCCHVPPSVLLQLGGHGVAEGRGEARVDRWRDMVELDNEGVPGEAGWEAGVGGRVGGRGGRQGGRQGGRGAAKGRSWAVARQPTKTS